MEKNKVKNQDRLNKQILELEKKGKELLRNGQSNHGLSRTLRWLLKESALQKNHLKGLKQWQKIKDKVNTRKIQIGGGTHLLEGFLNVDIVSPADLIWDVREGMPFKDECCEFIFSEHFLEHIDYPYSVKRFVSDCYRILKPSGKVVIGVPDGGLAARKYMVKDKKFFKQALRRWYSKRDCLSHFNTDIDLLNYVFRDQDDHKKYSSHLWAYDFEKLESLFRKNNFGKFEYWKFDSSIANPKRKWSSIYVVATK